ncbi:hypothetical protein SteCoe_4994 [Stentor coeruleus]|uniref:RING-type domain-containing protein n=1 Tax=Stentor coeruleus TaxID=5963 RepID=A0A1R2CT79_9CILI|nr:hypothetical protein SteCoe_4994 [Stentor coeruleus]
MNMDGKICQKLCACCNSTEKKYFVNSAEFHTICYNCAQNLQTLNIECINCKSNINIEYLSEIPPPRKCDWCGISPAKKCQDKKHAFCVECKKKIIQCPLCFCGTCYNKSSYINNCRLHSQCQNCSLKFKDWCRNCYCQICHKTFPEIKFAQCRHPACLECVRNGVCLLCDKKCTYCSNNIDIGTPICRKHPYCKDCQNNFIEILKECPECTNQTNKYKCFKCQLPRANLKSYCNSSNHKLCDDCYNIGKNCNCVSCFSCEKIMECSTNDYCKHVVCRNCKDTVSCKKCKDSYVLCSGCNRIKTLKNMFFQCNEHNACDSCLRSNKQCQKCMKKCEKCEIAQANTKKLGCGHMICNGCLQKYSDSCALCFKCDSCKNTFKRVGIANKSLCDKCIQNFEKNKECILCENPVTEKNSKCKHGYCIECISKINECQICKTCRGCKIEKGIILNKSKHWVCKECDQNQKCCNLCMENKKCDICLKISKSPLKYDCGKHKGCKKCKKHKVCECMIICTNCCEYSLGDFMNCSHFLCKKCQDENPDYAINSKCSICIERCFSCRSPSNLNKIICEKKEHILCKACNPYRENYCIICPNNLLFRECQECKKKNYTCQLKCSEHFLCLSCFNSMGPECEKCLKTCKECNNSSYNMGNRECGHALCIECQKSHLRNCEYYKKILCEICQESLIQVALGCLHQICTHCLGDKNYCIKCYSKCSDCGNINKIQYQCEHKLCGECFNKYNNCGVCSKSPECKCDKCNEFTFKLFPSECGHKFCEKCKSDSKGECRISVCHYCDKCFNKCEQNLNCKKNVCSIRCNKYKDLDSCPKCIQLTKNQCQICRNVEYGFILDCNHFVCIFCDFQKLHLKCSYCKGCESPFISCNHLCTNCSGGNKECWVCLGFAICENKKHFKKINSICEKCQCLHCGSVDKALSEDRICDTCANIQKICRNCFEIYYYDDIQNERAIPCDICNKCFNSVCSLCNKIFGHLLNAEKKKCMDCNNKEKCNGCQDIIEVSKIIEKDKKCISCSEFLKCQSCGNEEKKEILLKLGGSLINEGKCLACLEIQQCQKCLNYYYIHDIINNSQCLNCEELGRCSECLNLENIHILKKLQKCANCAGLHFCRNCQKLKNTFLFDQSGICYDCLSYKQCLLCKVYKSDEKILESGICEGCPKIKCNSCFFVYDRNLSDRLEKCPNCSLVECPKCHVFRDKAEIDYNDNCCTDCSIFKNCQKCNNKITKIVSENYYNFCYDCYNCPCECCFIKKQVKLTACKHFECSDCSVADTDYCAKCMKKFRCATHNQIKNINDDNKIFILMDCCQAYFCKNCKARYIGEDIQHRSNCVAN